MSCSNKITPIDAECSNDFRADLPIQEHYEVRICVADEDKNFIGKLLVINDCTQKYYGKVVKQDGLIITLKSMTIEAFEKEIKTQNTGQKLPK